MLPPLEPYTLVLLVRGDRAHEPADDEALDRLQEAHLAYQFGLVENGKIVLCGPLAGRPELRGVAVFRTSIEEATELMSHDPVVQAGRLTVQAMTWWVEKGRMPV